MRALEAECPDCGGAAHELGPIPATDVFAGRSLERPLPGGWLYRCPRCSLGFRWPRLGKEDLDSLYASGDDRTWTAEAGQRRDWRIARGWLTYALVPGGSILDVGCFDGGFLGPLSGSHRCYGIEIHPGARERAEEKGVKVIGTDFSSVAGDFDCVTAFDVIEHVDHPRQFLDRCLSAVRDGGSLLVSTGNLDAVTFRLMGSRYWYCTIGEHISFVSPAWIRGVASQRGLYVEKEASFAHGHASFPQQVKDTATNLAYRMAPPVFPVLRRLGMGGKNVRKYPELADHPPGWGSAKDHFIVLLRKR